MEKIVIVGWNPSARALLHYFKSKGLNPTVFDSRDLETLHREVQALDVDPASVTLESVELSQKSKLEADTFIMTPKARLEPDTLAALRARGAHVFSELALVMNNSPVPVIPILGSAGKSTATLLLSELLKQEGKKVFNNLNRPASELLFANEKFDYAVLRLDTVSLDYTPSLENATMGILLNITQEQTDYFPSLEASAGLYQRLFQNVSDSFQMFLNAQDTQTALFLSTLPGKKYFFSSKDLPEAWEGMWTNKTHLFHRQSLGSEPISYPLQNLRLRGTHNRENLMAAMLLAHKLGVSTSSMQSVIENFRAPQGRVQFVKRHNSVAFYDDSYCVTVDGIIKSLHAFHEPVILISGGKENNADYTLLSPHIRQKVKNLILVGEAKEKINRMIGDFTETFLVGTMEEAAMIAYQKSRSGDVVLYSPGCEPFDAFKTLEERSEHYKMLIEQMTKPRQRNVFY